MWYPKSPQNLEEAKLKSYFVQETILKILFFRGATRGIHFRDALRLSYSLIDPELRKMREQDLIAPVGGAGIGGYDGMDFGLTSHGTEMAAAAAKRSSYNGPAPVAVEDYFDSVKQQKFASRWVKKKHLESAFSDVIVTSKQLDDLGPAINSGGPIFIYGKPGNGKTSLAERLARVFRQGIFIPHSIQVDGHIIQIFDEKVHKVVAPDLLPQTHPMRSDPRSIDARWLYVFRPFIIVGGELTLDMLDLIYREGQNCYEAPFQVKANCGVLLVDDFGRQIVKPKDFLNRWIFPLEKQLDFLTLMNGKKIEVPFEQILIFSTNLNPADLADEAFWRRIKYKVEIADPTEAAFKQIFSEHCARLKLNYDEEVFQHLLQRHYRMANRELRSVHPRDLLGHVVDYLCYHGLELKLTKEIIDVVAESYFSNVITSIKGGWSNAA